MYLVCVILVVWYICDKYDWSVLYVWLIYDVCSVCVLCMVQGVNGVAFKSVCMVWLVECVWWMYVVCM